MCSFGEVWQALKQVYCKGLGVRVFGATGFLVFLFRGVFEPTQSLSLIGFARSGVRIRFFSGCFLSGFCAHAQSVLFVGVVRSGVRIRLFSLCFSSADVLDTLKAYCLPGLRDPL